MWMARCSRRTAVPTACDPAVRGSSAGRSRLPGPLPYPLPAGSEGDGRSARRKPEPGTPKCELRTEPRTRTGNCEPRRVNVGVLLVYCVIPIDVRFGAVRIDVARIFVLNRFAPL